MHATLLREAHSEATQARDEALADAAQLRERLAASERACEAERRRGELEALTRETEVELLSRALSAAERGTDAGMHMVLLRDELRASEAETTQAMRWREYARALALDTAAGGGKAASPPPAPALPPPAPALNSLLSELRLWAEESTAPPDRSSAVSERLHHLEGVVERAADRFEALQREHSDLRRKYRTLKARLREARGGGAGGGGAAGRSE